MPTKMTYNYSINKFTTVEDPETHQTISAYLSAEPATTEVSVFQFGNVDAFGAMALTYMPTQISNFILHSDKRYVPDPENPGKAKLSCIQSIETVTLGKGWVPVHCNSLTLDA